MGKLVILQTIVPDYRKKVFSHLKMQLKNDFLLYSGDSYFEKSVKTDNSIDFTNKIRNHFFLDRKFLFQSGIWHLVFKDIVLILELNPRIISNWVILLVRKIAGKKTILWGHAWSRKGPNSNSDIVRNWMRRLANIIVVYTRTQAKELTKKMPKQTILFAPNAVIGSQEMKASQKEDSINNIIYVGRLTGSKKPFLLVKTFFEIFEKLPKKSKLIIVGEGDESEKIRLFVKKNNLKERVILKGHVSEHEVLKKLYDSSLLSISPGYVGLSITQSFGFGVPMLISKNENHSPELEAAVENENSLFFKTDSVDNLGYQMLLFFRDKDYWIAQRKEICDFCKSNYSIELMANTFINLLKK